MKIFKCEICGNVVDLLYNGGGALVCCGQDMILLKKNQEDSVFESHLPKIEEKNQKINVQIGEKLHPMEEKHYIEWVALISETTLVRKKLKPDNEPKVIFDKVAEKYEILAYCNIHGLYSKQK